MMKRTLKRGLSLLMTFLLVIGIFDNMGITASTSASITLYTAGGSITSNDWTAVTKSSRYTYGCAATTVTLPTPTIGGATVTFGGGYSDVNLGRCTVTSVTSGTY